MRYVPTLCLREGMVLAKSLYGSDGILLLRKGETLKRSYVSNISQNGFQGVYIEDSLSKDIAVESVIDDEVRNSAVRAVRDLYVQSATTGVTRDAAENAKAVVQNIVEEIVSNRNIMVNMIDLKSYDTYTYFHSVNVGVLSLVVGVALGLNNNDLYKLGIGAMLHDIGKAFISGSIINKPDTLTDEEFSQIRRHPQMGYAYLLNADLGFPIAGLVGVLQHHERMNGSGYPDGILGTKIHRFSRIISIADVFDAMTSDRPYRAAMMPSEVMEYLMGGAGTLFDPDMVRLFTRRVAAFPLGTCVLLSNGTTAIVVENYEDCCLRPKVRILSGDAEDPVYLDLKNDRALANLTVQSVVKM